MEYIFAGFIALSAMVAFGNWRLGMMLAIVIDAVADPIRKLTPEEPVWITHLIAAVWLAVLLRALASSPQTSAAIRRVFPNLASARLLLILAILPAAAISLLSYHMGWFLVLIGGVSYLAPVAGVMMGIHFGRNTGDVWKFMRIFAAVNAVMLIGNVAEQFGLQWPALGGMKGMTWIRYMPGEIGGVIDLISGFYRSPDVSGFHAAHVAIFSLILAAPKNVNSAPKLHWAGVALLSLFCLFVTGRRKMYGLPVLFLLFLYVFTAVKKGKGNRKGVGYLVLAGLMVLTITFGSLFFASSDERYSEYGIYMTTTLADAGPALFNKAVLGSLGTVRQSGILGSGLGVATQGNKYAGIQTVRQTHAWQEDGTSRLFKELGVVGAILAMFAAGLIFRECWRCLRTRIDQPNRSRVMTAGLAIFAANACGFLISHQHISGSVTNALLPIIFLGAALGQVLYSKQEKQMVATQQSQRTVKTALQPIASDGTSTEKRAIDH